MEFIKESNRLYLPDEDGKTVALVEFPPLGEGLVEITRTYVDPSLRGQGIAGTLMEQTALLLRQSGRRARPRCSYAVRWFEEHPEYADVLENK